jgi:GntR family transcriptional repressor for pyruvate dehydrogenase complex
VYAARIAPSSTQTPAVEPLQRSSLADQVGARITDLIRKADLRPGEYLPSQGELCERFGVSRPILREAMKSLIGSGVIEVHNGRGAIVAPLNRDPLLGFFQRAVRYERNAVVELMEMRKGIEVQAAVLASERRSEEQVAGMQRILEQMGTCLHDPNRYNALDLELHLAIAEASANTMLLHLMASVRETLQNSIREGFRHRSSSPPRLSRTQSLHEELVTAIAEADPARTRTAMELHFDDAIEAIRTLPPVPDAGASP